jgi:sugar O-acyltransferase (sialic acid O-acetyltransferase NeuD family)
VKKPIFIYGAGGLGREVLSLLNSYEEWDVQAFIDDYPSVSALHGVPVLTPKVLKDAPHAIDVVVAVGDPHVKARIVAGIDNPHVQFPVIIHPKAVLQSRDTIVIGAGTVICAGVVITTDVIIGRHVLLNLNVTIGHDARIGDYSSVMPGVNLAGSVHLEERVLIGSGANVKNGIRIGAASRVGMGAVVTRSVEPGLTVVGIPAKPLS